jgi:hypothetical protein
LHPVVDGCRGERARAVLFQWTLIAGDDWHDGGLQHRDPAKTQCDALSDAVRPTGSGIIATADRAAAVATAALFSREPWPTVEELFHNPFASRGAFERWFRDFGSPRFQPRIDVIDVIDERRVLRVTAELPGMECEDVNVSAEDGGDRAARRRKQDVRNEEDRCYSPV